MQQRFKDRLIATLSKRCETISNFAIGQRPALPSAYLQVKRSKSKRAKLLQTGRPTNRSLFFENQTWQSTFSEQLGQKNENGVRPRS